AKESHAVLLGNSARPAFGIESPRTCCVSRVSLPSTLLRLGAPDATSGGGGPQGHLSSTFSKCFAGFVLGSRPVLQRWRRGARPTPEDASAGPSPVVPAYSPESTIAASRSKVSHHRVVAGTSSAPSTTSFGNTEAPGRRCSTPSANGPSIRSK